MKKLNLVILIVGVLANLGLAKATWAGDRSETQSLSKECSALLTNSQYAKTLALLLAQAKKEHHALTITGCSLLDVGSTTFVSINLVITLVGGDAPPMPFGNITGEVKYSRKTGEPTVAGAYYEPAASPPGGASVGN